MGYRELVFGLIFVVCMATPSHQCLPGSEPPGTASTGASGCPPGVEMVNCFADPCQVTTCPNHPNAVCKSNFCGGCNAEFFVDGSDEPSTNCQPDGPDGSEKVDYCASSPCLNGGLCRNSVDGYTCDCAEGYTGGFCEQASTGASGCPPGVEMVNCFADPCQVTTCPNHPNAVCKSNYCGGCNAEFFVDGSDEPSTNC